LKTFEVHRLQKGTRLGSIMEDSEEIYDGLEYRQEADIDWNACEITEELALQIGVPAQLLGSFNEPSKKIPRVDRYDEDEEDENVKFCRFGSLGRIIKSSCLASTPPGTFFVSTPNQTSYLQNDQLRCDYIKKTTAKFIEGFNSSDMDSLAELVRELCAETCLLITPDVNHWDCIVGRANVMMLFSTIIEIFPDGVYRTLSSTVEGDQATVVYSFTGTRLFMQSIDKLYKHCRQHVAEEINDVERERSRSRSRSDARSEDYSCDEDVIQISKTKTETVDFNRTISPPSSSETSQKGQPATLPVNSTPYQTLFTRIMPHAGRLGSDALKDGPTKQKRSMEMHFNDDNQIVKIIFMDLNPGP
jgi:SnoaL-like domain